MKTVSCTELQATFLLRVVREQMLQAYLCVKQVGDVKPRRLSICMLKVSTILHRVLLCVKECQRRSNSGCLFCYAFTHQKVRARVDFVFTFFLSLADEKPTFCELCGRRFSHSISRVVCH